MELDACIGCVYEHQLLYEIETDVPCAERVGRRWPELIGVTNVQAASAIFFCVGISLSFSIWCALQSWFWKQR